MSWENFVFSFLFCHSLIKSKYILFINSPFRQTDLLELPTGNVCILICWSQNASRYTIPQNVCWILIFLLSSLSPQHFIFISISILFLLRFVDTFKHEAQLPTEWTGALGEICLDFFYMSFNAFDISRNCLIFFSKFDFKIKSE